MRNYFIFDEEDSRNYGVYISGQAVFDAPARRGEQIQIPGRNGNLHLDDGSFDDLELTYPAFIVREFDNNIQRLRNMLLSKKGFCKLYDSYHDDEYRLARYASGMEVSPTAALKEGRFEITFDCHPQRFLRAGDTTQTFTAAGSITNPTLFASKPLIRVYGTGTVGIGSYSIKINTANVYTDFDCDIQDAYKGTVSCNSYIELSGNKFPVLEPGANGITLGTGITRVEITPRWWRL